MRLFQVKTESKGGAEGARLARRAEQRWSSEGSGVSSYAPLRLQAAQPVLLARAQSSRLGKVQAASIDDSADPRLPLLPRPPHCAQLRTGE